MGSNDHEIIPRNKAEIAFHGTTLVYYLLELFIGFAYGAYMATIILYMLNEHVTFTVGGISVLLDVKMAAVILALSMFVQAILEAPLGWVADRFGKTPVIRSAYAALLLAMLFYLATSQVKGVYFLVILLFGEVFIGAAMALRSGALDAWMVNSRKAAGFGDRHDHVFARAQLLYNAALATSGTMALLLVNERPQIVWIIGAFGAGVCCLIAGMFVRGAGEYNNAVEEGGESYTDASFFETIKYVRENRKALWVICVFTVLYAGWFFVAYFYPTLFSTLLPTTQDDPDGGGALLAAGAFFMVTISRVGGNYFVIVLDKWEKKRARTNRLLRGLVGGLASAVFILVAGGVVIYYQRVNQSLPNPVIAVLIGIVMLARMGEEIVAPTLLGLLNQVIERDDIRATALSVLGFTTSASLFITSIAVWLLDDLIPTAASDIAWLWIVVGVVGVLFVIPAMTNLFRYVGREYR